MASFSENIRADVWRYYGKYSLGLLLRCLMTQKTYRPVYSLRLCQATKRNFPILFPFAYLLHSIFQNLACLELPWRTNIGPGFKITHGLGIIINESVSIGSNVTILQGVTVGAKISGRSAGAPVIEDNVTVGASAIIIGGITLSSGAIIGAGAVVTRDVPANAVVAIESAKVIKINPGPRVSNPYTGD